MKLIDRNNSSSLVIDNIKKVGNRVNFSIAVFLLDKRTDTNIRFETESFVEIDEWQQKGETLLSDYKLELENFSFHADHKVYEMEEKSFEIIQNYFELLGTAQNNRLKFVIESRDSFERMFVDEIGKAILSRPSFDLVAPAPCVKDDIIHIKIGVLEDFKDESCSMQLELFSENFHMTRTFEDLINGAIWISEQIRQFNKKEIAQTEILDDFIEIEFNWVDGKKKGKGSVCDFTWPDPNELTFDYYVEVEWENVEESSLPIISYVTNKNG